MRIRLRWAAILACALFVACAGPARHARPALANVEVEVLFERPAHLVTTIVTHDDGEQWGARSRARRRVVYLTLARGGPREILVSQVFESLVNIPSGFASVTGSTAVSDSCYSASRFEMPRGAEIKLRQRVSADARCELACFIKLAERWQAMPCVQ